MNDFGSIVVAFGRGIIKVMISALVGVGIGLLVVGIVSNSRNEQWPRPREPEIFMGIGAGLLTGGGTLLALFLIPLFSRRPAEPPLLEEPPILARPAPKQVRSAPIPDESSDLPVVKPVPPPRPDSGGEGFYEKL